MRAVLSVRRRDHALAVRRKPSAGGDPLNILAFSLGPPDLPKKAKGYQQAKPSDAPLRKMRVQCKRLRADWRMDQRSGETRL